MAEKPDLNETPIVVPLTRTDRLVAEVDQLRADVQAHHKQLDIILLCLMALSICVVLIFRKALAKW